MANSLHALAEFVAGLHLPNGSVAIPGFYELAACLGQWMHLNECFPCMHIGIQKAGVLATRSSSHTCA